MAIKNTLLGGSDWVDTDGATAQDMNDTFDAAYAVLATNPAFYLNSGLYDVYDDFESYSTGTFTTNAKWTVATTGGDTVEISASTNAGGTGQEVKIRANSGSNDVTSIGLVSNRHTWCRVAMSPSSSSSTYVSFSGTAYTLLTTNSSASFSYTNILVIAKGSDIYDVYSGGKKLVEDTYTTTPQIGFKNSSGESYYYIDDVRQSKYTVD